MSQEHQIYPIKIFLSCGDMSIDCARVTRTSRTNADSSLIIESAMTTELTSGETVIKAHPDRSTPARRAAPVLSTELDQLASSR